MPEHSGIDWNQAVRKQFILHPERYGVMGQYSREMLEAVEVADYMADTLMLRLSATVLSGRTVSEHPQVEMKVPASWFQHWKHHFDGWVSDKDELWKGRDREGSPTTPPPWTIGLWPLLVAWPRWLRRHPVRYSKMTASIDFSQHILYPEVDAPAQAGRAVVYEEMSMLPLWEPRTELWGTSLQQDPSRFLNRHEIASEIYRDPELARYPNDLSSPHATLLWLERHGVNVDQLVKRR